MTKEEAKAGDQTAAQSGFIEIYADTPGEGFGPGLRFDFDENNLTSYDLPEDSDDGTWNDDVSTIYLPPGQNATFYEHKDYNSDDSGRSVTLEGGPSGTYWDLGGDWWNDEITSFDIWGV
jgi:hypothetical protein